MGRRVRRKFTKEFKVQAIELSDQLGSISEAAEKLGIKSDNLRLWKQKLAASAIVAGQSVARAVGEAEEIKKLRKQISDLEKTNYILKKAAAFFSQDHLK